MDYIKFGNTGMNVSPICLGCMSFGDAGKWTCEWFLGEEDSCIIIKLSHIEDVTTSLSVKLSADEMNYLEEQYVPHKGVGTL